MDYFLLQICWRGVKKKHFTNFIDFNFIDIDKNDIETWEKPKSKEKIELKFAV